MGNLVFQATLGGQVNLVGPNTASTYNINVPAVAGTMVTTGDTGTVTNTMLASSAYTAPGTIGSGTPNTGAFTTLSASSTTTLSGGTANGVAYLNGSKVLTTGSALVFDGTNLGVGVTPSAWHSSARAFQLGTVADSGVIYSSVGFNHSNVGIGANFYQNSSFNPIYIGSYAASKYQQDNGVHSWYNAPSGTAGNAITFTQAMTLDASGNLLVGTTSRINSGAFSFLTNASGTYTNNGMAIQDSSNGSGFQYLSFNGSSGTQIGNIIRSGTNNAIQIGASSYLAFAPNFTEAARIDPSGNLLVGTTSVGSNAVATFYKTATGANQRVMHLTNNGTAGVNSPAGLTIYYPNASSGNGSTFIECYDSNTTRFVVLGSGNVQNANNSYGAISDVKLKENIADASPKLADLMQVKVRSYNLKSDPEHKQIGVIAQELETVFPALIDETPDTDAEGNDLGTTTKSVKYSVFVPMLVKAIQEQQALIVALREELDAVKTKVGA